MYPFPFKVAIPIFTVYTAFMRYDFIEEAIFLSRPNRFIAEVELHGTPVTVHVKNTGRCRELLVPGTRVLLNKGTNPSRRTPYDLVSVYKGDRLINMDSQAPNHIAEEYLRRHCPEILRLAPEKTFGDSRFDFAGETEQGAFFLEIKGVTLEHGGIAMFPDAPTERGVKHLRELIRAKEDGYEAGILFIIQMKGITCLRPNYETHPAFGDTLKQAAAAGVRIGALDCKVVPGEVTADAHVPVELT